MSVSRTICLGFLGTIAVGTLLLMLPIATSDGSWNNFIVALFTATSATCVTGLIVVDTGTYYSNIGEFIILFLIQIGGLGYMSATTFLLLVLGHKFRLRDKMALQQTLDTPGLSGVVQLLKSIVAITMLFELTGAFALIPIFYRDFPPRESIWLGVFHSISAFNNAGFSLFADSLMGYVNSVPLNIVVCLLVIFGGLGYQTIVDLYNWLRLILTRTNRRLNFSLHFKIVTTTTLFLLFLGTVVVWISEARNPNTIAPFGWGRELLAAFFHSVITRTAGFNSIDIGKMTTAGLAITIALMFIGGSPGSTAGGIKTTTFRVLTNTTRSVLRGREDVNCYQREIPIDLLLKAVAVVVGSLITILAATILISLADPQFDFIHILFEVVSGFATVGLSMGITANLSWISKVIIIVIMYVGRVGVLLLMTAIVGDPLPSAIDYPEEDLLVG